VDAGVLRSVRVADVMVTRPKTVPDTASITQVRAVFDDDHVVMVLLTDGDALRGTLLREDLPSDVSPTAPALPFAQTTGRTVTTSETADAVLRRLLDSGQRRLAVVTPDGRLRGLVCLKRRRTGFCTDEGVAARAGDRRS
jgi:CBS domain-containing protein